MRLRKDLNDAHSRMSDLRGLYVSVARAAPARWRTEGEEVKEVGAQPKPQLTCRPALLGTRKPCDLDQQTLGPGLGLGCHSPVPRALVSTGPGPCTERNFLFLGELPLLRGICLPRRAVTEAGAELGPEGPEMHKDTRGALVASAGAAPGPREPRTPAEQHPVEDRGVCCSAAAVPTRRRTSWPLPRPSEVLVSPADLQGP